MSGRFLVVVLFAALGACASAPTQDMADARIALRTAEQAGAREHANTLLARAKRSLADAEAQLESGLYEDARANARKAAGAALAARNVAEEIAIAKREIATAQQLNAAVPAAESALSEAIAASTAGQHEKAIRAARRGADIAHSQSNVIYLDRARTLRDACQSDSSTEAELARADLELAGRRGAEAFEILQRICISR